MFRMKKKMRLCPTLQKLLEELEIFRFSFNTVALIIKARRLSGGRKVKCEYNKWYNYQRNEIIYQEICFREVSELTYNELVSVESLNYNLENTRNILNNLLCNCS
jgi:hypothetical protein